MFILIHAFSLQILKEKETKEEKSSGIYEYDGMSYFLSLKNYMYDF